MSGQRERRSDGGWNGGSLKNGSSSGQILRSVERWNRTHPGVAPRKRGGSYKKRDSAGELNPPMKEIKADQRHQGAKGGQKAGAPEKDQKGSEKINRRIRKKEEGVLPSWNADCY